MFCLFARLVLQTANNTPQQEVFEMKTMAATWMMGLALVLAAMPTAAQDYVLHGRVSFDAGNTLIKGAEDNEYGFAATNTLVLPGDMIWVDQGGATEMEFAGGSFVRVADGSKTEIVALPPNGEVRLWTGSLYLHRLSRSTGGFVVRTPAATVDVDSDSQVRIDVVDQGATTVSVRWGRAEIRTEQGGTTVVNSGQRAWVDPGYLPSDAVSFDRNREDAFDQWNRERVEFLATGSGTSTGAGTTNTVIQEPVIGKSELGRYGEWVYVDSRPYWRPTVVVDYVPYRYGRWHYTPVYGHVWTGHYPFCHVTSHYGRWRHTSTYGWIWGYDPVWSPAWVATIRVGDYFVWAPVDRYHRPVLVTGHSYFTVGGVRFSFYSSSYAPATGIYYGPSYIHPVHTGFYRYVNDRRGDIHIWNININTNRRIPVPYDNSVTRVRDYNPNRSIRSTRSYRDGGPLAVDRVRNLENRSGRSQFTSVDRTGARGARTVVDSSARDGRVRDVRLTREAPSYTRATRDNPEVASRDAVRGVRGGDAVTQPPRGGATRDSGVRGRDVTEAPGRTVGGAEGRTPGGTDRRNVRPETTGGERAIQTPDRAPRPQTGGEAPGRGRVDAGRTTPSETVRPDRTTTPRSGADRTAPSTETGAPARGVRPDAPTRTPARPEGTGQSFRVEDQPGGRGTTRSAPATRSPERSEVRTAPGSPVDRGTSIRGREVEGTRGSANIERTPTRTPDRTGPASREPSTPNVQQRTAPQVQQRQAPSAPQRGPAVRETTPQRQAPQVQQRTAPEVQQRQAPSVQQRTAPQVQQRQAPSVQQRTAPQVQQRSAPQVQQRQAPQVQQRSAPQVQQRQAPQVQQRSAPQVQQRQAPQVQQRQAPQVQQRSAPQVQQRQAPQVQQRQAPQVQQRSAPAAPRVEPSAPNVQRSAPATPNVRQSAPNVQRTAPSAPSVQRSAPNVQRSAPTTSGRGTSERGVRGR